MYLAHLFLRCISLLSCLEVLDFDTAVEVTFLSSILKDQHFDRDCVRGIFTLLSAAPCGGSLGIHSGSRISGLLWKCECNKTTGRNEKVLQC